MVNINPNPAYRMNRAAILGSTGSVGTQTAEVLRELGIPVSLLTAGENTVLLAKQVREFRPAVAAVASEAAAARLREQLNGAERPEILWKQDEILDAIRRTDADIIFHSVAGLAGLESAEAAAESGKRIGMANKEAIVAAGDRIFELLRRSGGELIPVDSEHCAVYRCLEGKDCSDVSKIILTASGGPFVGKKLEELKNVTAADALNHPTWKMGKKITVDSATLMNKGFEIIEAVRLFGMPEDRVEVIIHRQSIIHSMVEYHDHTVTAWMGHPDMRDCIRYAATAPHTAKLSGKGLDFAALRSLTFESPDTEAFPLMNAARSAIRRGGTVPLALIAADETAVEAFLAGTITFPEISRIVLETLGKISVTYSFGMAEMREADEEARRICRELISESMKKRM